MMNLNPQPNGQPPLDLLAWAVTQVALAALEVSPEAIRQSKQRFPWYWSVFESVAAAERRAARLRNLMAQMPATVWN
jgi:hypothetical protein